VGVLRGSVIVGTVCLALGSGSGSTSMPAPPQLKSRVIHVRAGDASVKLYMREIMLSTLMAEGFWGSSPEYENFRTEVVWNIVGVNKGEKVWFPRSAFSDLASVSKVTLIRTVSALVLSISGSEASQSYTATIKIVGSQVASRTVRSRIAPSAWFEKTTYTNKTPDWE
jgi:hypothetical protein